MAMKPQPKQQTREGYEIPVPTRRAVLGDLKRVARSVPKGPDKAAHQPKP